MDQPTHAESAARMIARLSEIIAQSPAFLRSGTVIGIDSVRRHLPDISWASPTAFRYVTPPGPTLDHGPIFEQPRPIYGHQPIPRIAKPLNGRRIYELKFRTRVYQSR
jgi:hypothetical protein